MEPLPWGKEKMMSLSDKATEEFRPLDPARLDSFNDERYSSPEEIEPDLERFKLLYEPEKLAEDEPADIFEFLYDFRKKIRNEDDIFAPLFDTSRSKKTGRGQTDAAGPGPDDSDGADRPRAEEALTDDPPEPTFAIEFDRGYEEGKAKGYDEGFAQGFDQGQAQGFATGESEGMEKGEKSGHEQGFEKGEKEARQQIEDQIGQTLEMLHRAVEKCDLLHEELIDRYEKKIVELINAVVEKVIYARIESDNDLVRRSIADALKKLVEPENIVLSISHEDYETVEMIRDDFFAQAASLKHIRVVSDPSVHRGGCRIETKTADVRVDPAEKMQAVIDSINRAMTV